LDLARWDWISEDFMPLGIRIRLTSTAPQTVRFTAPTWERVTDEGVRYLGNQACDNVLFICVGDPQSLTLAPSAQGDLWVYVQPRLRAFGRDAFTTEIGYENLTTGETGTIPVDVSLTIWEPQGNEPPPDSVSTIIWSPPTTAP